MIGGENQNKMELAMELLWSYGVSEESSLLIIKLLTDVITDELQRKLRERIGLAVVEKAIPDSLQKE